MLTWPMPSEGKPTRTAGSVSDRGQEAARQVVFWPPFRHTRHRTEVRCFLTGAAGCGMLCGVAQPLDLRTWDAGEQCNDFRFEVGGVLQRESGPRLVASGSFGSCRTGRTPGAGWSPATAAEGTCCARGSSSRCRWSTSWRFGCWRGSRRRQIHRGTERGYQDFEIAGPRSAEASTAVDVKAARRAANQERGRRAGSRCTRGTRTSSGLACTGRERSGRSATTPVISDVDHGSTR